jgi:hypothetical protein
MRRDSKVNTNPEGVFIQDLLLACDEIGSGAKLTQARLAQQVRDDNPINICLRKLAAGLGSTEEEIAYFLVELEEYGFILIDEVPTGRNSVRCKVCYQRMARLTIAPSKLPSADGHQTRDETSEGKTGVSSEKARSRTNRRRYDSRQSCYDLLTLLAYTKRCKEKGERIASVHALARYLYRTGDQDRRIPIVLELVEEDNPHRSESSKILPFELKSDSSSPTEIQREATHDR